MHPSSRESLNRSDNHPIRLIVKAYRRSGLMNIKSTADFAQMVGCSDSLIRNTESGRLRLSEKLSHRIELATGVSSDWLLRTDAKWREREDVSSETIMDVSGKHWQPSLTKMSHHSHEIKSMAALTYQHAPSHLHEFFGIVLEILMIVQSTTAHDDSVTSDEEKMQRFLKTFTGNITKMITTLEANDFERFFHMLNERLEESDSASPSRLRDLWKIIHPGDSAISQ
jgi:hypothetical protein